MSYRQGTRSRKFKYFLGITAVAIAAIAVLMLLNAGWSARRARNEREAVSILQRLHLALRNYAARYPQAGYPVSLTQLGWKPGPYSCQNANLLDEIMAQDFFTKSGYDFVYLLTEGSGLCSEVQGPSSPGLDYSLFAQPSVPSRTGARYFFLDSDAVIRASLKRTIAESGNRVESLDVLLGQRSELSPQVEGIRLKDVIIIKSGAFHRPPVRFDHKAHSEERLIDCEVCHHAPKAERPPTKLFEACTICHEPAVRIPMKTNTQKAFHGALATSGTCIDCHKKENQEGRAAPVVCSGCHIEASF